MKADKQDFFIGWADTPAVDRRFFLRAGVVVTATTGGLAAVLAAAQKPPGPGRWDPDAVREWRGIVTDVPYAMLRSRDLDGSPRTILLSCLGKCGVAARIGALAGQPVVVRGSLIERGRHAMLAVDEERDWIRPQPNVVRDPVLAFGAREPVGEVRLAGEVLDSKCWFGAMRPSEGKVHRSCASLCIRGGIPPAFFARGPGPGRAGALMIMTSEGRAHGPALLPFVAEPVRITGLVYRQDDLLFLDSTTAAIERL